MTEQGLGQVTSRGRSILAHRLQEEVFDEEKLFDIAQQYGNYCVSLRMLGRERFLEGIEGHLPPTDYSELMTLHEELPDSELSWVVILYVGRSIGREKETKLLISKIRRCGNYCTLLPFELN